MLPLGSYPYPRRVPLAALALVLVAAFAHASWNAIAKGAPGGAVLVFAYASVSSLILLPCAIVAQAIDPGSLAWSVLAAGALSGTLHGVYFVLLQRGYARGDLSVVYPLARGSGPVFATLGAIVLLGDRPGPLALVGTAGIVGGVLVLLSGPSLPRGSAAGYALATGILIGTYTVWDGHLVRSLDIEPVVLMTIQEVTLALLLAPVALRRRAELRVLRAQHARAVCAIAILSPAAYVLVLFALRIAPVSYVAPAREVSILVGALIGTRLLAEGHTRRRVAGAVAIVGGVLALALG